MGISIKPGHRRRRLPDIKRIITKASHPTIPEYCKIVFIYLSGTAFGAEAAFSAVDFIVTVPLDEHAENLIPSWPNQVIGEDNTFVRLRFL